MYRQVMLRSTRSTIYPKRFPATSRALATAPPPQGQSGSSQKSPGEPEGSNMLIVLSALGALGGLYYYYTHGKSAEDRERARREEAELERKVREFPEIGKNKAEAMAKQGQKAFEEAKTDVRDAASAARTRGAETRADVTERARLGTQEAQAKFDEYKQGAERSLSDARNRSEKKYEEIKEEMSNHVPESKNTKRSWFGWGK